METLKFGFVKALPYKKRLALDVPDRIFGLLRACGSENDPEGRSVLALGQGSDLETIQVNKLPEGGARLMFKLTRKQGIHGPDHQQKRLRNVLSIMRAVQVIATPEERDPAILLAPSLHHKTPGVYPFSARITWGGYGLEQRRIFATDALTEAADMLKLAHPPDVKLSRVGGVLVDTGDPRRLLSTAPDYRRVDPFFKLTGEALNYTQQMAYAVGAIALARPELLA